MKNKLKNMSPKGKIQREKNESVKDISKGNSITEVDHDSMHFFENHL